MLASVPFPVIPLVTQRRIVEAVTSFDREIETLERRIAKLRIVARSVATDLFIGNQHWRRIRLAETGTWLSGGTPNTANEEYWAGDIPWISAASMKNFYVADSDRRLTRLGAASGTRVVPEGTTLFVVRGMSLNNEFRVGIAEREVAFGQDCKAIIPKAGIEPIFLAHALDACAPQVLAMVETTSHGTGRLDTERLERLTIGVPPVEEQRRVVDAVASIRRSIDTALTKIGKLHTIRKAVTEDLLAGTVKIDDL
jgi:restriction endonuclease S subunit